MIHRASAIGGCLKSQIAAHLGMKPIAPDDASRRRMDEGSLHEGDVVARLVDDGWLVERQQDEVYLTVFGPPGATWSAKVEGHLDGVISADPQHFASPGFVSIGRVLEIKSMGKSAFAEFKAKGWEAGGLVDRYRWQISCYMHATGLEALVVAKSRDSGELLKFGVELPFYTLDQIAERVGYIEDHVARGQLPDDCPHDWFCDFKYLCSRSSEEDGAEHSSDELSPVEVSVVSEYHRLGREIKALEDLRADTRLSVEALAGRSGGGYRVQMVTQQIKERVVPAGTRQMLRVTKTGDEDAR